MPISLFLNPAHVRRSCVFAALITGLLCPVGYLAILAHYGGPLLLLFAPTFPVYALLYSLIPHASNWQFFFLAVIAEFIGVFVVVHFFRLAVLLAKDRDA